MRVLVSICSGLALTVFSMPTLAGTLANYTAKPAEFKVENGVRVLRIKPAKFPAYQNPIAYQNPMANPYPQTTNRRAEEQSFERGYDAGFEAGYEKATQKRTTRRNRYNYGRRYSTSGFNPRYRRFGSNISYGRPAFVARSRQRR